MKFTKRFPMTKPARVVVGAALLAVAVTGTAKADYLQKSITAYKPEDCKPVVEQVIDDRGIDRDNITKIEYLTYYISDSEAGEDYHFQAWMNFKNCKGNFVVDMNRACQIDKAYSMGNCDQEAIGVRK